jgi:hypothetical protein
MSQLRACAGVLGALLLTGCMAASAAGVWTGPGGATGPAPRDRARDREAGDGGRPLSPGPQLRVS